MRKAPAISASTVSCDSRADALHANQVGRQTRVASGACLRLRIRRNPPTTIDGIRRSRGGFGLISRETLLTCRSVEPAAVDWFRKGEFSCQCSNRRRLRNGNHSSTARRRFASPRGTPSLHRQGPLRDRPVRGLSADYDEWWQQTLALPTQAPWPCRWLRLRVGPRPPDRLRACCCFTKRLKGRRNSITRGRVGPRRAAQLTAQVEQALQTGAERHKSTPPTCVASMRYCPTSPRCQFQTTGISSFEDSRGRHSLFWCVSFGSARSRTPRSA